jgi:hypothetical protein
VRWYGRRKRASRPHDYGIAVFIVLTFAAGFDVILFAIIAVVIGIIASLVIIVLVAAGVSILVFLIDVAPPGALADGRKGAFIAVFVVADVIAGGKFVAVGGLLRGLNCVAFIKALLAVDELRCNLDAVEKGSRFLQVDAAIDDGVVDAGH